jgi:hypothetical protein
MFQQMRYGRRSIEFFWTTPFDLRVCEMDPCYEFTT